MKSQLEILDIMVSVYIAQGGIACIINYINGTRSTNGFWDFLKLIFLPYVLLNLKSIKDKNIEL